LITEEHFSALRHSKGLISSIDDGKLYFASHHIEEDIDECALSVIKGNLAIILDDINKAIIFDVKGFQERSISEPTSENVLKGAKDTFIENIRINTSLIRRKICTPNLRLKQLTIGRQSITDVVVIYIKDLTNEQMVEKIITELEDIDIDEIKGASYVEEYIIGKYDTVFPLIDSTERTDKFSANIIAGKVGLIIGGVPRGFLLPAIFNEFLQAPEDYAQNYIFSSFIRFMRFFLLVLGLSLPAFYISLTTFHQELIPTELAIAIGSSKEGVPFPTFVEALSMLLAFEILIEAGLRLPQTIGDAVSILGALVIGDAAVSANLLSPGVVIVIAFAGISSFTIPNQDLSNAIRLWRFVLALFSSLMGLLGLAIGSILLLMHLCSIEIFTVPYLSPFVNQDNFSLRDTIFRLPLYMEKYRPKSLKTQNKRRQR
ncbi:MAG: spore germination protein, partial [Clostridiales bacterium]|nr:spore germination protein [Clostridiales bacterium]